MFYFGESAEVPVQYYLAQAKNACKNFPDGDVSRMTQNEAVEAYLCSRVACRRARKDDAPQPVLDALDEHCMTLFEYLIEFRDDIAAAVESGRFRPACSTLAHHREIAKRVRHPSSVDAS